MSSGVARAFVVSEPMHRPMTARNRIPSNGRSMPDGRAGAAGGTSVTSWIVGGTVVRSAMDQRVCDLPAMNVFFWLNHCASSTRAIGAAASAPKPPSSTVTASTIGRLLLGTKHTYQDWSPCPGRWAVPVLPNTGKSFWSQPLNTSADVPPDCEAAACRPWRMAWRAVGSSLTWRGAPASIFCSSRPVAEAEPARHALQRLALDRVEIAAERVEEDVGGDLERARQRHRSVRRVARV